MAGITKQMREEAIRRVRSGEISVSEAAREYGVKEKRVKNWIAIYDLVDLIFFIGLGLLVDLVSILIAGVGTIGASAFGFIFYLKGVSTSYVPLATSALIELVPILSAFPAVTLYVIVVYLEKKAIENGTIGAVVDKAESARSAKFQANFAASEKRFAENQARSAAMRAETNRVAAGVTPEYGGASGKANRAPEEGGQSQEAKRTLPDGSQSASGSPIAGGESGSGVSTAEPATAKSSGQQGANQTPDQVSKEEAQQQAAASGQLPDQSKKKTPESALAPGNPLEQSPATAQMPTQEKKKSTPSKSLSELYLEQQKARGEKPDLRAVGGADRAKLENLDMAKRLKNKKAA